MNDHDIPPSLERPELLRRYLSRRSAPPTQHLDDVFTELTDAHDDLQGTLIHAFDNEVARAVIERGPRARSGSASACGGHEEASLVTAERYAEMLNPQRLRIPGFGGNYEIDENSDFEEDIARAARAGVSRPKPLFHGRRRVTAPATAAGPRVSIIPEEVASSEPRGRRSLSSERSKSQATSVRRSSSDCESMTPTTAATSISLGSSPIQDSKMDGYEDDLLSALPLPRSLRADENSEDEVGVKFKESMRTSRDLFPPRTSSLRYSPGTEELYGLANLIPPPLEPRTPKTPQRAKAKKSMEAMARDPKHLSKLTIPQPRSVSQPSFVRDTAGYEADVDGLATNVQAPQRDASRLSKLSQRGLFHSNLGRSRPLPTFQEEYVYQQVAPKEVTPEPDPISTPATPAAPLRRTKTKMQSSTPPSATSPTDLYTKPWAPPQYPPAPRPRKNAINSKKFSAVLDIFDNDKIGFLRSPSKDSLLHFDVLDNELEMVDANMVHETLDKRKDSLEPAVTLTNKHRSPLFKFKAPKSDPVISTTKREPPHRPSHDSEVDVSIAELNAPGHFPRPTSATERELSSRPFKTPSSLRRMASIASERLQRRFSSQSTKRLSGDISCPIKRPSTDLDAVANHTSMLAVAPWDYMATQKDAPRPSTTQSDHSRRRPFYNTIEIRKSKVGAGNGVEEAAKPKLKWLLGEDLPAARAFVEANKTKSTSSAHQNTILEEDTKMEDELSPLIFPHATSLLTPTLHRGKTPSASSLTSTLSMLSDNTQSRKRQRPATELDRSIVEHSDYPGTLRSAEEQESIRKGLHEKAIAVYGPFDVMARIEEEERQKGLAGEKGREAKDKREAKKRRIGDLAERVGSVLRLS